jgi:hypothetical protein
MQKVSTCALKVQCDEIFDFRFFPGSVSPMTPPAENLPPLIDPVLLILEVHLVLRISPRIFEKSRNEPNFISGASGKIIYDKTLRQKSPDTVPLKSLGDRRSNHSARSHLKVLVCVMTILK